MVLGVVALGNGEQRGDRPALDDLESAADEAPFDVLRAAEMRLDPPAELRESHDLGIGSTGCSCRAWSTGSSCVPPPVRLDGELLVADRLADDLAVPNLVDVRVDQPETSASPRPKVASTETIFRFEVTGSAVKSDAGGGGEHHLLHDHGHADLPVVDAVRRRYVTARSVKSDAQHRHVTDDAAGPTMLR